MTLKVYVIGSSDPSERERVRSAMDAISATPGLQLSHDWLKVVQEAGSANAGLTHEQRKTAADDDLTGIARANAVLFLAPTTVTRGAWLELGAALGMFHSSRVVCAGNTEQSIFCALGTEVATDAEALDYLRGLAAKQVVWSEG